MGVRTALLTDMKRVEGVFPGEQSGGLTNPLATALLANLSSGRRLSRSRQPELPLPRLRLPKSMKLTAAPEDAFLQVGAQAPLVPPGDPEGLLTPGAGVTWLRTCSSTVHTKPFFPSFLPNSALKILQTRCKRLHKTEGNTDTTSQDTDLWDPPVPAPPREPRVDPARGAVPRDTPRGHWVLSFLRH